MPTTQPTLDEAPLAKSVALVEREPGPPAAGADVTLMFERLARDPAVDVEKFERLMAMQERVLAHSARAAFNQAFAAMQGDIPTIVERGKTDKTTYARLEDIIGTVRPILQRHGFTLSHRTEWPDAKTVRVIGILTHAEGHERTSEFLSAADASGSKNAIQGLGSAVAYGRRYTTKDLLAIVTTDEDDDGQTAGQKEPPKVPAGYDDWLSDMTALADDGLAALQEAWGKSKREYRDYTAKHKAADWAALKRKAGKATS